MNRRQLLVTTATASGGLVAGCLDFSNNSDSSYATLQALQLWNRSQSPITAIVRIEHEDGEVVHEDEYELPAGNGTELECVWPDDPIQVMVRYDERESWKTLDTVDRDGYIFVLTEITDRGIGFYTTREESPLEDWLARCHTETET